MAKTYVKNPINGLIYSWEDITAANVPAIDPNSFAEKVQVLQEQAASQTASATDITTNQIPAVQQDQTDYEAFVAQNP